MPARALPRIQMLVVQTRASPQSCEMVDGSVGLQRKRFQITRISRHMYLDLQHIAIAENNLWDQCLSLENQQRAFVHALEGGTA